MGTGQEFRVIDLTFRTLFWSSEASVAEPPAERGGRALHGLLQTASLFVSLVARGASHLPAHGQAQCCPSRVSRREAACPPDERLMTIQPRPATVRRLWLSVPVSP